MEREVVATRLTNFLEQSQAKMSSLNSAVVTTVNHGCHLLRLPLEIREMVYRYLLVAKYTTMELSMNSKEVGVPLSTLNMYSDIMSHSITVTGREYKLAPTRLTISIPQFLALAANSTKKAEIYATARITSYV